MFCDRQDKALSVMRRCLGFDVTKGQETDRLLPDGLVLRSDLRPFWNIKHAGSLRCSKCIQEGDIVMADTYSYHGVSHPMPGLQVLTHIAAGFFTAALVTDIAYTQTMVLMWQDFSSWLLFFGLIVAAVASVLWLISLFTSRIGPSWGVIGIYVLVMIAAFLNSLIHAGDGWKAIVPWGVSVSAVTCVLMLAAAFLNRQVIVSHHPNSIR